MASSNTLTYDQDTPHRAALSELGGGDKKNHTDPNKAPDPVTMLTAEDENQNEKQIAAFNRICPLVRLWVTFSAGTPSIASVQAMGENVLANDFTVVDNGDGDTTIWWTTGAGGTLPPVVGPKSSQTSDVEIDRLRSFLTVVGSNPAVRIKSKLGAVATDANFVVELY